MPRRTKFIFGSLPFTSIKGVEAHARLIRGRHPRGATINDPQDVGFLADLFSCNVEAEQKRGRGIKRFYWSRSPDHPTDCFWVERIEGPPTDFGVPASIRRIGTLNRASLRAAVQSDIDAFRAARLPIGATHFVSDFSGRTYPVSDMEVDHVPTFQEIVSGFYSERGIDVENLLLTRAVDGKSEPAWRSEAMIEEFRTYHRGFKLRLVSSLENQSDIKRRAARSASPGEKEGG
jgi:hypothetical protein